MTTFKNIWDRIEKHSGKEFKQIRGGKFTYEIRGNQVVPDRTNQNIPKSHFEKAFDLLPLENTVPIQNLRGPSYIFAILMDERILYP